ncbi:Uu.00g022760.m01.CDS01 [Anthostomella pinea]|uniref:Uu.00g022760.m01.CDS01 n=1 Tax=Anthostomella pinea TaxID=933095 RepID=A0AAI8VZX1_9PEZI|nr:Uu.00g022760.m01.CDS01 [Anthostomella pinea]
MDLVWGNDRSPSNPHFVTFVSSQCPLRLNGSAGRAHVAICHEVAAAVCEMNVWNL